MIASVILYNPDVSVIIKIGTYIDYVTEVIVVDNSDIPEIEIINKLKAIPKITYISNNGNLGIAKAMNIACEIGINKGYKWILTMDQDSFFEKDDIFNLIKDLDIVVQRFPNLGILTPSHVTQDGKLRDTKKEYKIIKFCMASGNLVNLQAWFRVNGFLEKLFIDYVDHEFCLRLRRFNFVIVQTSNSALQHFLGNTETFKFLGVTRTTTHHNHIRRYYITRNRLFMIFKYIYFDPRTSLYETYNLFAETFKLMLKENDRLKKIKSVFRGTRHFLMNKYGKYKI